MIMKISFFQKSNPGSLAGLSPPQSRNILPSIQSAAVFFPDK